MEQQKLVSVDIYLQNGLNIVYPYLFFNQHSSFRGGFFNYFMGVDYFNVKTNMDNHFPRKAKLLWYLRLGNYINLVSNETYARSDGSLKPPMRTRFNE